jgi:hypothetical protein
MRGSSIIASARLNLAKRLAPRPPDLATLLGLAGSEVQEMAGEILGQNVLPGEEGR